MSLLWGRKKTPTVIQMEAVECGAAALSSILAHYGRHISLEELREKCGVSRHGVSAFNILEAAKFYGMDAAGYEVSFDQLKQIKNPSILFWENRHFVVLENIGKSYAYINDPAVGPKRITKQELERSFSGVVLEMTPAPSFKKEGKPLRLRTAIQERLSFFKDEYLYLFLCQLSLIILGLATPIFFQIFIDKIIGLKILNWAWEFIGMILGVVILTGWLTWKLESFLNALRIKLSIRYVSQFLWHILRLPISFFTQRFGGEIINRIQLNRQIAEVFAGQIALTCINVFLVVLYALIMFQYDPVIASMGIFAAIFNLLLLYGINRARTNAYASLKQEEAKSYGLSLDLLENIETMKMSSSDSFFFSRLAGLYTRNINAMQNIGRKDAWLFTLSFFSQQITLVFLFVFGVLHVMQGYLTIGMLIALQILLTGFLRPFTQLVSFGSTMQTFKIDLSRIDDVLKNPLDQFLMREAPIETDEIKLQGQLEVKNLEFGYSPLDEPFIKEINFSMKEGQWTALVGGIGSGKSTVAKLCANIYQPWKGKILYDDKENNVYSQETLRKSLSFIDQEIFIFAGSIKDNITLWDSTIPLEKVIEAAQDAQIHEDIISLSDGYFTKLQEGGSNFSAGQRQRLEIARALLLEPTLLIFDEATRCLDKDIEEKVIKNIKKRKCTCLLITHRLNIVTTCDEIIVLDQGRIVQRGTSEELKSIPGKYRDLFFTHDTSLMEI